MQTYHFVRSVAELLAHKLMRPFFVLVLGVGHQSWNDERHNVICGESCYVKRWKNMVIEGFLDLKRRENGWYSLYMLYTGA
jgi:hypothetical protein